MSTSEGEGGHHRSEVRANAVLGDKMLSAIGREGKRIMQTAAKLIA
ncbi:MAG: hypothetical protein ACJLS3_07835 [Erythrobacter sp.]